MAEIIDSNQDDKRITSITFYSTSSADSGGSSAGPNIGAAMRTRLQGGSTFENVPSPLTVSRGEKSAKSMKSHPQHKRPANKAKDWFGNGLRYIHAQRTLLILSTFIFLVISGAGVTICHFFAKAEESEVRDEALALAIDTGKWFAEQLDLAILPLFSLAQFAIELEIFSGLPERIGEAGEPGSLPFLPSEDGSGTSFRRNITGVCDDPLLWERFTHIASSLKRNAQMEGVLVNLQLAPQAVVCLLHPLNNTEDFEDGIFMDNKGTNAPMLDGTMREKSWTHHPCVALSFFNRGMGS